jgi:hypothetical protein
MSKQTSSSNSSFENLDLLSYLKSGQTTPFPIFIHFIMPQFLHHLSKRKQHLISTQKEDSGLQLKFEKIQEETICIDNIYERLKECELHINKEFRDLILRSLDDAYKERTENSRETKILEETLDRTLEVVSMLKNQIYSIKELSSDKLESRRFKSPLFAKKLQLNIDKMMAESSTFKEIKVAYDGLGDELTQNCLLCFSVLPQKAVIKKKALVHWWVGEKFLSHQSNENKTDEEKGYDLFQEFITKGIIEPVSKKRRPSSEHCRMHPLIRYAVIVLAKEKRFIRFDSNGNPTADFSDSNKRGCLVTTEEGGSSLRELTYGFRLKKLENVQTLFNVSEPCVDLREDSFSKMRNMKVVQLGRCQASAKQIVEAPHTEFLKGLKKMKHLRYFSIRGITRVRELPDSICKLTKLVIVDIHGCRYLERLPEGIGSLTNLTCLDISGCSLISHMPVGLASLSKLQVLQGFLIGRPVSDDQKYCTLADLAAKLEYLKKLSIDVDVRSTELAPQLSHLSEFKNLVSLSVAWSKKEQRTEQGNSTNTTSTSPGSSSLAKLELQFLPYSEMPDWMKLLNLENLKKLYVRGGKLSKLHPVGCEKWKVSILRLELLSKLQMDWRELRALFPRSRYVKKLKCPQLILFPCDDNGEWASGEADTEHA